MTITFSGTPEIIAKIWEGVYRFLGETKEELPPDASDVDREKQFFTTSLDYKNDDEHREFIRYLDEFKESRGGSPYVQT